MRGLEGKNVIVTGGGGAIGGAICRRFAGTTTREVWATLERELGHPLPDGFFERHIAHVRDVFSRDLEAIPGARAAVEALDLPYCVASSTHLGPLITNIATAGLADLFDGNVFSASQVKRPKPAQIGRAHV